MAGFFVTNFLSMDAQSDFDKKIVTKKMVVYIHSYLKYALGCINIPQIEVHNDASAIYCRWYCLLLLAIAIMYSIANKAIQCFKRLKNARKGPSNKAIIFTILSVPIFIVFATDIRKESPFKGSKKSDWQKCIKCNFHLEITSPNYVRLLTDKNLLDLKYLPKKLPFIPHENVAFSNQSISNRAFFN